MERFIVKLKGLSYRKPNEIAASRLLDKNDILILSPEPDNVEDPFAIKVLTRPGIFIGYIDRVYSAYVSSKLSYSRCSVLSIKQTVIPCIDLQIAISDDVISQPEIERDLSKLTPSEKMMILDQVVTESCNMESIPVGYYSYGFMISWTEELPRANVLRAASCCKGDELILRSATDTRYSGRIEVLTNDNILIGYIDEEFHPGLAGVLNYVISPKITSNDSLDRMQGGCYLPAEIYKQLPSHPGGFFDYPFKEVSDARYLAKDDPLSALDMIAYAMSHEKGIVAHEVALTCYWYLKDWELRRKTALSMLDRIDCMQPDEWNKFTYNLMKTTKYQKLIGIVETCDKKIIAAIRKKR